MNKTVINFWLNLVSFIVMLCLVITGGIMYFILPPGTGHSYAIFGLGRHEFGTIHFYFAIGVVVLVTIHLMLHWSWVCCVIAKSIGKNQPKEQTQRAWGIALFLGVVVLLLVLFIGLPRFVKQNISVGPERRALVEQKGQIHQKFSQSTVDENSQVEPVSRGPRLQGEKPYGRGSSLGVDKHLETCPLGASINGQSSFIEAARSAGLTVNELAKQIGLSQNIDPEERLGKLKRAYGFSIHDIRKIICSKK